jgi:hypothetical protein
LSVFAFFTPADHPTVCCSLVRQPAGICGEIKNRASGFPLSLPATVTVFAFTKCCMRWRARLAVFPSVKRAANGRVTDSGFKKKL